MSELPSGCVLSAASVQRMDTRSNFRKTVERCAALGVRITHNGIVWMLEGGPADVRFGALDLSTLTLADLKRRNTHGNRKT